jgi:hypothetical protein
MYTNKKKKAKTMPKKIYQVTVTVEFEYGADRSEWLENLQNHQPTTNENVHVKNVRSRLLFENCRLCGIKRNRGTLGSGIMGEPADECRAAHINACQRRRELNAKSAS